MRERFQTFSRSVCKGLFVFADAGYQGAENREELADVRLNGRLPCPLANSKELKKHPGKNKAVIAFERLKSSVRAKVEHLFRFIKRSVQGAPKERQPTGDVVYAGESVSSGPDDTGMEIAAPKIRNKPRNMGVMEQKSRF